MENKLMVAHEAGTKDGALMRAIIAEDMLEKTELRLQLTTAQLEIHKKIEENNKKIQQCYEDMYENEVRLLRKQAENDKKIQQRYEDMYENEAKLRRKQNKIWCIASIVVLAIAYFFGYAFGYLSQIM